MREWRPRSRLEKLLSSLAIALSTSTTAACTSHSGTHRWRSSPGQLACPALTPRCTQHDTRSAQQLAWAEQAQPHSLLQAAKAPGQPQAVFLPALAENSWSKLGIKHSPHQRPERENLVSLEHHLLLRDCVALTCYSPMLSLLL